VDDPAFSPLIPSPPRVTRLFGSPLQMNFGGRSHPTMLFNTSTRMPVIYTSNGFCFCVQQATACSQPDGSVCGFTQTVRSLYDQTWRKSTTLTAGTADPCVDQLDWPYEGGTMRDGTVMANRKKDDSRNSHPVDCDITDRLPPFWYRYMPNGTITTPGTTSLDHGGACHMGVAPEITTSWEHQTGICRKVNETQFNITVICHLTSSAEEYQTLVLNKTLSKAPDWAVAQMKKKRQKCDACPAVPSWTDQSGETPLPKGAEVLYGIPFRWSAARSVISSILFFSLPT
jgi:hypothetical protein